MKKNIVIFSITCLTFAFYLCYFSYKKISAHAQISDSVTPVAFDYFSNDAIKNFYDEKVHFHKSLPMQTFMSGNYNREKKQLTYYNDKLITPFFSPKDDIRSIIISHIDAEDEEILSAIFRLTDKDISSALLRAHQRGVKVRIIVDRDGISSIYSKVLTLFNHGVEFYINPPIRELEDEASSGLMHHKVILFKKQNTVITGSFNYTKSAQSKNKENIIVIEKNTIIFDLYWQEMQNIISESSNFEKSNKNYLNKKRVNSLYKKENQRRKRKRKNSGAEERT